MVDYKKMYTLLCDAVYDSLDMLPQKSDDAVIKTARFLLQRALIEAEDIYIETVGNDTQENEYE